MDTFELLDRLTQAAGASGNEKCAASAAGEMLEEYGTVTSDKTGGFIICRRDPWIEGRPVFLLDAHIDEIAMTASYITEDGFIKASACGGIDFRTLMAQQVTVYGKERLSGVVACLPPHLESDRDKAIEGDCIYIDVGLDGDSAKMAVPLGSAILVENTLKRLCGGRVTAKALDNRAGCAAVIRALELLKGKNDLGFNIAVMLSSQEELGERGAVIGAYAVEPDLAVIVDTSFAKTHFESGELCGMLGKGPMIGISPSLTRSVSDELMRIAEQEGIPYQVEVMSCKTGTNADAIGVARGGVMTATVSVPERHMHTPVEIVELADIENTAALIAKYLESVKF